MMVLKFNAVVVSHFASFPSLSNDAHRALFWPVVYFAWLCFRQSQSDPCTRSLVIMAAFTSLVVSVEQESTFRHHSRRLWRHPTCRSPSTVFALHQDFRAHIACFYFYRFESTNMSIVIDLIIDFFYDRMQREKAKRETVKDW